MLLAETDDALRRALARALRSLGIAVDELDDGEHLLVRVAFEQKPGLVPEHVDAIVSEISLPVPGGLQALRSVRASRSATPILLLAGRLSREVLDAAANLGAELLVKPFYLDDFERAVLEVVARRRPEFQPPTQ